MTQLDLFKDTDAFLHPDDLRLRGVATTLISKYKWVRHNPATVTQEQKMLFVVGCILTGGTEETRAILICKQIQSIWDIELTQLFTLATKAQLPFAASKAKQAYQTVQLIKYKYNKEVPSKREHLEALPGVGRHVASVIMATLFDLPEFAIDLHVRRVLQRLELAPSNISSRNTVSDLLYERRVTNVVDKKLLGHLSRAFVDFGQDVCGLKPRCNLCSLDCPSRNSQNKSKQTLQRQDFQVKFARDVDTNELHAVSIRQGRLRCTCSDFSKHFKCRHVEAVRLSMNMKKLQEQKKQNIK